MAISYGVTTETQAADNLLAGGHEPIEIPITLVSGQNLVRGTVLGRITDGGKYTAYVSTAEDGSQVPRAILGKDTNATSADQKTWAYVHGVFNSAALTGSSAAAALKLLEFGIVVK